MAHMLAAPADMSAGPDQQPESRRRSIRNSNRRVMRLVYGGCKSTKTLQDEVSQVPPGSYSETWAGLLARPLLGGLPGEGPRRRCIANSILLPICLLARSFAGISNTLPPCSSCHTMCCITTAVRGPRPAVPAVPEVHAVTAVPAVAGKEPRH